MDRFFKFVISGLMMCLSISMSSVAATPESGSFKIPQIVITNNDALKIVFDATKFAKKMDVIQQNIIFILILARSKGQSMHFQNIKYFTPYVLN